MSIALYRPWAARRNGFPIEFQQVVDRFFNGAGDAPQAAANQWAPRVDIREEDKRFVILADIPGVDPAAIEIHMDKGILSIKGERRHETREEDGKLTRVERAQGTFYRHFTLPDSADAEGITATGKHGVLEIAIPKKPETSARRISVQN
ncbi:MAG TPA: Hsp20/alpha crystallin family protein [Tahibacter sp.]|nr:Hsp20/alpha crystallin family protein [Tahibacter sp.]